VLSDTVGFIRDLPHDLVVAFRATLAEAADADLLLHVIDASADNRDEQIEAVDALVAEIGAADVPQIRVFNKCDVTGMPAGVERDGCGNISSVRVSAVSGTGLPELRAALAERFPVSPAPVAEDLDTPECSG
jgi:GTP-binding protein HflX